jgi:hypothetical protein
MIPYIALIDCNTGHWGVKGPYVLLIQVFLLECPRRALFAWVCGLLVFRSALEDGLRYLLDDQRLDRLRRPSSNLALLRLLPSSHQA